MSQSEGLYLTKEYYFDNRHRFYFDGCENAYTIEDVFELCKDEEEIFIFGGEQIYNMFLPNVEKMYISMGIHFFQMLISINGMKYLLEKGL